MQRFPLALRSGKLPSVDIDVHWPSGLHESFKQIPANRLITIKEGVGQYRTTVGQGLSSDHGSFSSMTVSAQFPPIDNINT